MNGEQIRIRGLVQGVGFRPTVFRVARAHGVRGEVRNDGDGVLIFAWAEADRLDAFVRAIARECPPLARIDQIDRRAAGVAAADADGEAAQAPAPALAPAFAIAPSDARGVVRTSIVPDVAACADCVAETLDPFARRYRYPFTNCTCCGPRWSIVSGFPYDRARTSMAAFALCADCRREHEDPADRRHHAQPIACHACGPRAALARADGRPLFTDALSQLDAVDAACTLLQRGEIVAVKGIGGFHLACDATRADAVAALRRRKHRHGKPLALMARSLEIVRRYCRVSDAEAALLASAAAPIVVLDRAAGADVDPLADEVAPGQRTLGFMLPYTPLHHLLLRRMPRPIVLTSGNRSDEPQCTDNAVAAARLGDIAPYLLAHDRDIVRRVDDSVVRVVAGAPRVLRRARGYAPSTLALPPGLAAAAPALAMGGEGKNTFCLVKDGHAILSPHIGDLDDAATFADYQNSLADHARLYAHAPRRIVVDAHPDYLASRLGRARAERDGLALGVVQHHHAHVAACLADNAWPDDAGAVLGVALDGMGMGMGIGDSDRGESDAALWGGEFLRADYRGFERVGTFKPVALLGGAQAVREPWRNTYAHLSAELGWADFEINFDGLDLYRFLADKPRAALDAMLRGRPRAHAPLASSCGRLFDAVAAAIGIRRATADYEGQAAIELEALIDPAAFEAEDELHDDLGGAGGGGPDDQRAYPFAIPRLGGQGLPYVEPLAMWRALLGDLHLGAPAAVIAARFHRGLANVIARMVDKLARRDPRRPPLDHVALSGGVFGNAILLAAVVRRLARAGFTVLTHRQIPPNDGGLALGQAVVDAARQRALPRKDG